MTCKVCGMPTINTSGKCNYCVAETYAAKWNAEHSLAEPPVFEEPTDSALRACFANCVKVPSPMIYELIRQRIH